MRCAMNIIRMLHICNKLFLLYQYTIIWAIRIHDKLVIQVKFCPSAHCHTSAHVQNTSFG